MFSPGKDGGVSISTLSQGKAVPFEHIYSYQDYIAAGYRQSDVYEYRNGRNIFSAVGMAVLVNAAHEGTEGCFETMFIRLFGEENFVHAESIRTYLETDYSGDNILRADFLATLLEEVWRDRVLNQFRSSYYGAKAKQGGTADIPHDHYLFPVMQKILGIRIVVFSSQFTKDVYEDQNTDQPEIILSEKNNAHYHYLTKRELQRVARVNLDDIKHLKYEARVVSSSPSKQFSLSLLPDDLKVKVVSFLSAKDNYGSMARVNKKWSELSRSAMLHVSPSDTKNIPEDVLKELKKLPSSPEYDALLNKLWHKNTYNFLALLGFAFACCATLSEHKKEPLTVRLNEDQYKLIELLIDENSADLSTFLAAKPDLDLNYMDLWFVSPLFWSIWLGNTKATEQLRKRGCQLLPNDFVISKQDYFLNAIKVAKVTPLFSEIIAENIPELTTLEFKNHNDEMLPMIFAPMIEGVENQPVAKTIENLVKNGARLDTLFNSRFPDRALILEILHPDNTVVGPHTAQMLQVLLSNGLDQRHFKQEVSEKTEADEKISQGRQCLYQAAGVSASLLQPFFQVYPEFCHEELKRPDSLLLHCAAGSPDSIRFLMKQGANLEIADEKKKNTPLHLLFASASSHRVRSLFSTTKKFRTAYQEYCDYISLLQDLRQDAKLLILKNAEGRTPFLEAAQHLSYDVLNLFDRKDTHYVTEIDCRGNTALHLAIQFFLEERVYHFTSFWPTIKLLLEFKNLDVKARNNRNQTALDIALAVAERMNQLESSRYDKPDAGKKYHIFKVIKALLQRMDKDENILQRILAMRHYQHEFLALALDHFDINPNFSVTAELAFYREYIIPFIHQVIAYGNEPALKQLLKNNRLDVNALDKQGDSALLRLCISSESFDGSHVLFPESGSFSSHSICNDWQISLAKQLLSCQRVNVNQARKVDVQDKKANENTYNYYEYLTPLLAAALRHDLRLFTLLIGSPRLKLRESDFIILYTLLKKLVSYHDDYSKETQQQACTMVRHLLRRPDFTPVPPLGKIEQHQKQLFYFSIEDPLYDVMMTILLCRYPNIIRFILLHPNISLVSLRDEKQYLKITERLKSEKKDEINALGIWRARKALDSAEQLLLKSSVAKNNQKAVSALLQEVRKNDAPSLDMYVRQIFDTSFRTLYRFNAFQCMQLLQMPTVLNTLDLEQIMFLAEQYEIGEFVAEDKLFAIGLYQKASQLYKSAKEQEYIAPHLARARGPFWQEAKDRPIELQPLLKTLTSYTSWSLRNWRSETSAQAQTILNFVTERDNKHDPATICNYLISEYTKLKCQGAEEMLVSALKQALSPLVASKETPDETNMVVRCRVLRTD